ncbi:hypothetical protein J3458_022218 [Metarhizium acridum]|uniref:uncharacterized protein n=1 Tax=Metarhizium acridum TaxID=92637 RepID=UPI001C6CAC1F|nr:hypothetical protein J3458_022218 [Metarhizium acridum]
MHALLDGRGMLYLFDALFKSLSKQPKDEQTNGSTCTSSPNLARPLEEWLKFSQSPSQENIEDARDLFKRFVQDKPVRLPEVDLRRTPGRPVHRELSLSEKDSHRVVDACRIKGLTVTTAWHAALAIAVQRIQKEKGEAGTTYTQFTTIDLRRWFPEPFRAHQHSIGSLQTALPFAVDLGKESNFDKISQCLQKDYKKPFTFAHDDVSCLVPGMAMYKQMLAAGQVPPTSTRYLSSMGVVDDFISPRYGYWELTKYWVSSTMLTGDFQVYLWTWRGQMVFSACYNEAFYGAARVDGILKAIRDEMEKGLGVL